MTYYQRRESNYRVVVRYEKQSGIWEALKIKDDKYVVCSRGADFKITLQHATMLGPEDDEGAEVLVDVPRSTAHSTEIQKGGVPRPRN